MPPGAGLLSAKPRQLVHRASWDGEPGTLRARPSAEQLRCGRQGSELELLAEKVPGGHGWHCVSWLAVPGDGGEAGVTGAGRPRERPESQPGAPHAPAATTPAPGGQGACSRQKPACAKWPARQRQARLRVAVQGCASSSRSPQMTLQ